ncbi:MAG: Cna B-type domain-containing protein, partial [Lachnospiraceae bacterium]|nr:Cna B-type domain-containing protein [Lachnospiraceae bacterium]
MKKPKTGKYRSLVSAFLCCALLTGLLPTAVYADTSPVEEHSANTVQTDETADGSSNKGLDRREDRSAAVSNDSASSDTKAAAKESAAGKTDAADGKKDQKSEQPSDASRQTSSGNDAEEKAAESSEKKTAVQTDEGRHAAESEKGTVQLKASTGSRVDVQTAFSGKTFETTPKLTVSDVSEQEAEAAVKKALGRDTKVLGAVGADITFLANGQEVQPADGAQVSVTMKWQDPLAEKEKNVSYVLIHVHNGEAARMKSAEVSDTRVSFSADSFSEYIAAAVQDTGEVGTAQANASDTRIKIDYDETTNIHSVDNRNIILFCMNNQMHWPHDTPTFQAPEYVSVDFNDFFKDKENAAELAQRLKVLLYAGYPYNGLGLYEISDHGTISEAEFNLLLNPPEWIRTDFPDSIGSETFTYADLKDRAKMAKLTQFIKDSMALYTGGKTASGRTYQEVSSLPFWKAAYCMTQFSSDPREAYTQLYNSGYYVTESQAYENTSHAVWKLMYDYGVDHNNISSLSGFELAENLLKKASKDEKILENEPTSDVLSISGNSTFTYDPDQKIWQTGTLTLKAPENYHGKFTLTLPAGVSTEDGSITVQPGGSFRLISTKTPEDQSTVSLSASLVWMDGGLRMYTPAAAATASDGKGFQNMIGAVIRKKEVSASVTLSRKDDTTAVSVEKVWKDGDNQDGIRPKEVTIHLLADGNDTGKSVTLNAENNWKASFDDLAVYNSGKEIAYTVSEDGVKNYDAEITGTAKDGYTVTNTHAPEQTSVSVEKVWKDGDNQDGIRPEKVTIHLLADGNDTGKSVTLNAENNWKETFTDLDVYASGKKIAYTVSEDGVKNYDAEITGTAKDGYTVTNTHAPEQTSVSVEKVWKDGDNQDGIRPEKVTIHLLADGKTTGKSVTLNADNNWKATFDDLAVYNSGKEIAYTVTEDEVNGYTPEVSGTAKDGYTVTNIHTPEQTSVSVEKVWKDGDNQDGIRPKEVTIHLLADGNDTGKSVTLNAENNWKASFDDLAVYNSGKEIAYTVSEDGVKNYDAEITGT